MERNEQIRTADQKGQIIMNNIQQIEAAPIAGNASSDSSLMDHIHQLVIHEDTPMGEKVRALQKLDQVMGLKATKITAKDVRDYIKDSQ